jgi:uncharacterized glyoxalase superfamily metalloenzyme YdcJ
LPRTERELALQGLGFFTYRVTEVAPGGNALKDLLESGALIAEPIVYEDFLPRSAAGIFQSNLSDEGTRDDAQAGADYDLDRLAELVGAEIHDPFDLYGAQQDASLREAEQQLGLRIDTALDDTDS